MDIQIGDEIRITHLIGENNDYDGKTGKVIHIDSLGQLHGTWGDLAVIPDHDIFEKLDSDYIP